MSPGLGRRRRSLSAKLRPNFGRSRSRRSRPLGQQQLNIPQTQAEHMVEPHSVGDDLGGEAVPAVRVG
jgi:hypothetical protein